MNIDTGREERKEKMKLETKKEIVKAILDILIFLFISFIAVAMTDNSIILMLIGIGINIICRELNKIIDESEN